MGIRLKIRFCRRYVNHWWGKAEKPSTGGYLGYPLWRQCKLCGAREGVRDDT